eukprot:CAMPEP_0184693416 /NCGR_PEP_ID=MMETSP0313-20130426/1647_1 /TAXON_ID=2792 /ORGANISM="Porphyridium aerugineum, Strain SAG 1380-2" /LENGTH=235 /DNA_ID=CAMNT_0027151495 /DNA_START=272 /DNA_END=979 /DNA_ORIENTATION=-
MKSANSSAGQGVRKPARSAPVNTTAKHAKRDDDHPGLTQTSLATALDTVVGTVPVSGPKTQQELLDDAQAQMQTQMQQQQQVRISRFRNLNSVTARAASSVWNSHASSAELIYEWTWIDDGEDDSEIENEERVLTYLRIKTPEEVMGTSSLSNGDGNDSGDYQLNARGTKRRDLKKRKSKAVAKTANTTSAAAAAVVALRTMQEIPFWEIQHRKRIKLELNKKDIRNDLDLLGMA